MAPDGAIAMSVWSNIAECAKFMFRRFDPEFHDRAVSWGGGLIIGGHNYGQGSSRARRVVAVAPGCAGSLLEGGEDHGGPDLVIVTSVRDTGPSVARPAVMSVTRGTQPRRLYVWSNLPTRRDRRNLA
jgi:hypothetical protein